MESIAIISDIHSNLEALKTVLDDIKKRNIKRIFCLGDIIAKGNHPHECIELVKKNCEVTVQGNCDYSFSIDYDEDNLNNREKEIIPWNQKMLTKEDRKYLLSLPLSYEFYMSGSLVRIFHATPSSNYGRIGTIDSLDVKFNQFKPSDKTISDKLADVVIYGHVHAQFLYNIYNRTLVNAGSVGNSFVSIRNTSKDGNNMETTRACYVIITGEYGSKEYSNSLAIEFVKVPYDINKELADNKDNIEYDAYARELLEGMYRNPEQLREYFEKRGINTNDM